MNLYSIGGLGLDFAGVMLLGFDLVNTQKRLRDDAEDRLLSVNAVLEEIGGIDGWASTVSGDFRERYWDDGRTTMVDGSFDPTAAEQSFNDVVGTVGAIGEQVVTLAKMQHAAITADQSTAGISLRLSYIGLLLIAIGFGLQLPAYL